MIRPDKYVWCRKSPCALCRLLSQVAERAAVHDFLQDLRLGGGRRLDWPTGRVQVADNSQNTLTEHSGRAAAAVAELRASLQRRDGISRYESQAVRAAAPSRASSAREFSRL